MPIRFLVRSSCALLLVALIACGQSIADIEAGAGTGSSSGTQHGDPFGGPNGAIVKRLLTAYPAYTLPTCRDCRDGTPPHVDIGENCMRDTYVAGAVYQAWAVASFRSFGDEADAEAQESNMMQNLQSAQELCSDAPTVGGETCKTLKLIPCPIFT
jgi:hypothetical protein